MSKFLGDAFDDANKMGPLVEPTLVFHKPGRVARARIIAAYEAGCDTNRIFEDLNAAIDRKRFPYDFYKLADVKAVVDDYIREEAYYGAIYAEADEGYADAYACD